MSEPKINFTPLWIFLGAALAVLTLAFLFVYLSMPRYVPEYPTVLRPCPEGTTTSYEPIPIVIDGEHEILPCNDPVTIYPKGDR